MKRSQILFLLGLTFLALSGCLGIHTDPNRVRLLILPNGPVAESKPVESGAGITVLFREIVVPAYMERNDLIVYAPDGTLAPIPGYRWAEPVEDGILRILVNESMRLPGITTVRTEFQSGDIRSDYAVSIQLIDLLARADGSILVGGNLSVQSRKDNRHWSAMIRFEKEQVWDPANPETLARGMSEVIREFARQLRAKLEPETSKG